MKICKLCNEHEATQTNSHIIPWFLIKEVVNQKGFKERGYDVTFSISAVHAPSLFVGRSVLPEHIEKVTKRSVEDNVIDQVNDPFSRDYILCPVCETKISKLENEFNSKLYSKIDKIAKTGIDNKGNSFFTLSKYESRLTCLLVYSIFFRCSIVRFNNYAISIKMEDSIRKLLKSVLVVDSKELTKSINVFPENSFLYPVQFCYLSVEGYHSETNNMIIQNHSNMPYFIWANKVVFQLFEKGKHINSANEYFYGLSEMINLKEYFIENWSEKMKVCIISNENRHKMISTAVEGLANRNMNNMKLLFNDVCKKLLNRSATTEEKDRFGYHYSRFSTERFYNKVNEPIVRAILTTFNIPYENNDTLK